MAGPPSRATTTLSPSSLESFPILESHSGFSGRVPETAFDPAIQSSNDRRPDMLARLFHVSGSMERIPRSLRHRCLQIPIPAGLIPRVAVIVSFPLAHKETNTEPHGKTFRRPNGLAQDHAKLC
ncbi:uncharacterized protein BO96DRAFT_398843 [Aspergillus niger CBS 101883]|uniref:Contig An14c0180, genomic contig n=2 Tax=Aspergillus niger TaxID=5061 RepID=A2R3U5_ASPNC|nr:uncharacterized protein BO96DRAFT_398843 [Aspergillus niger CBS 101883]XP_059602360.1 uncharacterized protein An14g05520 [Aspergillus niger]PYH54096.1 hypothetical protein BO96DRAFT_398843 [Aspergillus niger CBS 101883]CAK42113.1 unnamed protein product [Aspergillus niger]